MHSSRSLVYLLFVAVVWAGVVVLYGRIDYTAERFWDWDLWSYRYMAAASPALAVDVPQPFAYRILGPYLAGLLDGPGFLGFYSLSVASSFLVAVGFYGLLLHMGIQPLFSCFAVTLFLLNKYLFGFTVWNYFHINDVLSLGYLVVLFWAMSVKNWPIFGLVLVLGAFTRETTLLMVPVLFIYLMEAGILKDEWRSALMTICPGVACFIALRLLIKSSGGEGLLEAFLTHYDKLLSFEAWYRLLVNSFLPVSLLPLIFLHTTVRFFVRHKHMLLFTVLVLFSVLFGLNNERLMAPAFLTFYLLIAKIAQEHFDSQKWLLAVLVVCAVLASAHHVIGYYTLPGRSVTIAVSAVALAGATLATLLARLDGLNLKKSWRELLPPTL